MAFPCENYGLSAREIRERTDAAIEALKLSHLKDRAVDVLSSGEKQPGGHCVRICHEAKGLCVR